MYKREKWKIKSGKRLTHLTKMGLGLVVLCGCAVLCAIQISYLALQRRGVVVLFFLKKKRYTDVVGGRGRSGHGEQSEVVVRGLGFFL